MEKFFTSVLIPYYLDHGYLYVFLQRRSADAPRFPHGLGAFGGKIEGNESEKDALFRELQEELHYTPTYHEKIGSFETNNYTANCYIEKVEKDFLDRVKVSEGEGGEWHKADEIIELDELMSNTKMALRVMIERFSKS